MNSAALIGVLLTALVSNSIAYPTFQQSIPNGENVPNPCNRSTIWPGVGHKSIHGAGPRNPFGMDFKENGMVWNRTLCEKDSDGDGLTNGQELGDPNCTWTKESNSPPMFSTNLSHPGICEPVNSNRCSSKNSWLMECTPQKLNCSAINDADVKNDTLRFPKTPIPSQETTYICHRFTLPNDSVADIVAFEPIIDNAEILHHMLIYGCSEEPPGVPENEAYPCGMSGSLICQSLIGIWSIGSLGQCLKKELGFRIGPGGFQYAIVQLHWNNPLLKMNLFDSSGMRIFYTTHLRPNVGNIVMTGQMYLEIPPGKDEVTATGSCTSVCTRKLNHSIFVSSILLHMHLLGKAGNVTVIRNGSAVRNLIIEPQYDYNTPRSTEFEPAYELKPGDEVRVACVYQSTQRNSTTYFGEATSDEMCYAFLTYYPSTEGLDVCGQWKRIELCNSKGVAEFESCEFLKFLYYLVSLNTSCAENCSNSNCATHMGELFASRCMNYTDVTSFAEAFLKSYYATFIRCSSTRLSSEATTPFDTTSSLTTELSSYNTVTTEKPTLTTSAYNRSAEQKAACVFGVLLGLVIYAINRRMF